MARLTGYILMAVQHHLCRKRGMPAHFDGEMSPVGIQDMKVVMIYIGHLSLQVMIPADVPYRYTGSPHQDEEDSSRDAGLFAVFFRQIMLALPNSTVQDRNRVSFGIAADPAAETAGHPHHLRIIQGVIRSGQCPPPHTKTGGTVSHLKISIHHDPVHAIVAAVQ